MDIGRSFTYATEDQDWLKKVLIGGLISLIPIVGQFYALGYAIEVMRRVIAGQPVPLPEPLEDLGDKLVKGLVITLISLIYALPIILVAGCLGGGMAALTGGDTTSSDTMGTVASVLGVCVGLIMLVLGVLVGLIVPFAMARYAETGELGQALRFGDIWKMFQQNIGGAFVVLLVYWLAGMLAAVAGTILCGVGLFFTAFYSYLIMAFLYGSLYRQARPAIM